MSRSAASFLLFAAACDQPVPSNPEVGAPTNAELAAEVVWDKLGQSGPELGEMPEITWMKGPCLLNLPQPPADCVAGWYVPDLHRAWLVYKVRPSDSSLAHELVHAALHLRGTGDESHQNPIWAFEEDLQALIREIE